MKLYDSWKVSNDKKIPNENLYDRYNRDIAIKFACRSQNQACLDDSSVLMKEFLTNGQKIPAGLELNIMCSGLRGTKMVQEWMKLWNIMKETTNSDLKALYIYYLGCTDDEESLKFFLESTISGPNTVIFTEIEKRDILTSALKSLSGFEIIIDFIIDNELDIMSNYGLSYEEILFIPAKTIKNVKHQNIFFDKISTISHLDVKSKQNLNEIVQSNFKTQIEAKNAFYIQMMRSIVEKKEGVTTTTVSTTTDSTTPTTQGASSLQIKIFIMIISIFVNHSLQ